MRKTVGVSDKAIQPNHAWRHTFIRRAFRSGIEKNIRTAMCGHGFEEVSERYETPSVSDMAHALTKFPRYEIGFN